MKKAPYYISLLVIFATLLGSGCTRLGELSDDLEDVKGVKWSPEFALPLVNSTLELSDLISSVGTEFINVDDQQLIHLIYRGDLVSLAARDLLAIGDQTYSRNIGFTSDEIATFENNDSVVVERQFLIHYDLDYDEIDSMFMKLLNFEMNFNTDINQELSIDLELPDVKKNGVSYTKTLQVEPNQSITENASLNGYSIDMMQGPSGFNEIIIKMTVTARKTTSSTIEAFQDLNFELNFNENRFERFYGYIGVETLITDGTDTLNLNVFDKSDEGAFSIDDPRVKLIFLNGYGIPVKAELNQFKAISDQSGVIDITGFPTNINVPIPSRSQMGQTLSDSIVLNKTTSNIGVVVSSQPEKFIYELDASTNPNGKESQNFAVDTSHLTFRIDLDIPLKGTADGFRLEQESAFDFDFGEDVSLDYLVFRLYLENEFPVDLDFQMYFVDDNNTVLDSLIAPRELFIKSPEVDVDGRSTGETITIHDVNYSRERLERIRTATKYKIEAGINTYKNGATQPTVSFYEDYGLRVQLGIAAKVLLEGGLGD